MPAWRASASTAPTVAASKPGPLGAGERQGAHRPATGTQRNGQRRHGPVGEERSTVRDRVARQPGDPVEDPPGHGAAAGRRCRPLLQGALVAEQDDAGCGARGGAGRLHDGLQQSVEVVGALQRLAEAGEGLRECGPAQGELLRAALEPARQGVERGAELTDLGGAVAEGAAGARDRSPCRSRRATPPSRSSGRASGAR